VPITIPPFSQYQAPLFPMRGLWNAAPAEGDRFIAGEIDWGSYPAGQAVQFSLSGNSPVAFSQIAALSVDNSRCGSDVQFVFTDSGSVLQVPAHCQGVYPVFTNSLGFFVVALNASPADVTCVTILNSLPPPIPIQVSTSQSSSSITGIALTAPGTSPLIGPTIDGVIQVIQISTFGVSATGAAQIELVDGTSKILWVGAVSTPGLTVNLSGLSLSFTHGLSFVVTTSSLTTGTAFCNVYYGVP
jgi:hypothetical protein